MHRRSDQHRRPLMRDNTATTSSEKRNARLQTRSDRAARVITVDSNPYMLLRRDGADQHDLVDRCIVQGSAMTSARAPSTIPPQIFGCGCGSPVLPDGTRSRPRWSREMAGGGSPRIRIIPPLHRATRGPCRRYRRLPRPGRACPDSVSTVAPAFRRTRWGNRSFVRRSELPETDSEQVPVAKGVQYVLRGRTLRQACVGGHETTAEMDSPLRTAMRALATRWAISNSLVIRFAVPSASVPPAAGRQGLSLRYTAVCAAAIF